MYGQSRGMAPRRKPPRQYRKHYLREWRVYRFPALTIEAVADLLSIDRTTLGRIENRRSPYSQGLLEAAAELYKCEPWDLLNRDPSKEGLVIDITDELRAADSQTRAEILGYVRGRLQSTSRH